MKAWLWDGSAGVDHLRLGEAPNPVAEQGEVVLEVRLRSLKPG